MLKISTDILDKIQIPQFNINTLRTIDSEKDFIAKELPEVNKHYNPETDNNIKDSIVNAIIDPTESNGIKNTKDINMNELCVWCEKYPKIMDDIESMSKLLESGKKNAETVAKSLKESGEFPLSFSDTIMEYFMEAGIEKGKDDGNNKDQISSDTKKIEMYFKLCSEVICAKMTSAQRIFNIYFDILNWHIQQKGGKSFNEFNKGSNNKESK